MTEEFAVAPKAFLGSFRLGGAFTIAAALLSISTGLFSGVLQWVTSVSALGLSMAPLLLFSGFLFGFGVVDSYFNSRPSVNVIGSLCKPGTATVRRLLILSGHHDSAWENNWFRLPGYGFFLVTATFVAGFVAMPALTILQLAGLVTGDASVVHLGTLGWVLLAYPIAPSAILWLSYSTDDKDGGSVPGAADNLSACGVVAATCRFLVKNPECIPEGTEIRFITFGSEEAGLQGSRRYVQRHLEELRRLDARLLNLEIVASSEVGILTSEVNGTVKNSPAMVKSVVEAASRAGVPFKVKPAFLGVASDAGPFSKAGIKATTLLSFRVPQQMLAFYHQKWDRPEVLSTEPLLNALKISLEWIRGGGAG